MFIETFPFPGESIRCLRGDYILQRRAGGRVRVLRVEDLVRLNRLVPYGDDALIEERTLLDSERPAYMGEVHLLLTLFERELASPEEATQAIDAGNLGPSTGDVCMDIRSFPTSNSQVYRLAAAGQC